MLERRLLRKWGWHFRWRALPLWVQSYLIGWIALSVAITCSVAIIAIAVSPSALAAQQASTIEEWTGRHALALLGYIVTFGASVAVGLWRLGRLEKEAVTKDQLATHVAAAAGERNRLADSVAALSRELASHVRRMDMSLGQIDKKIESNAHTLQDVLVEVAAQRKAKEG